MSARCDWLSGPYSTGFSRCLRTRRVSYLSPMRRQLQRLCNPRAADVSCRYLRIIRLEMRSQRGSKVAHCRCAHAETAKHGAGQREDEQARLGHRSALRFFGHLLACCHQIIGYALAQLRMILQRVTNDILHPAKVLSRETRLFVWWQRRRFRRVLGLRSPPPRSKPQPELFVLGVKFDLRMRPGSALGHHQFPLKGAKRLALRSRPAIKLELRQPVALPGVADARAVIDSEDNGIGDLPIEFPVARHG